MFTLWTLMVKVILNPTQWYPNSSLYELPRKTVKEMLKIPPNSHQSQFEKDWCNYRLFQPGVE